MRTVALAPGAVRSHWNPSGPVTRTAVFQGVGRQRMRSRETSVPSRFTLSSSSTTRSATAAGGVVSSTGDQARAMSGGSCTESVHVPGRSSSRVTDCERSSLVRVEIRRNRCGSATVASSPASPSLTVQMLPTGASR